MNSQWPEERLQQLVRDEIAESINLDYKQADALPLKDLPGKVKQEKRSDLSKDVSAFANSQGGVILYGIPETGIPPKPVSLDGVDPSQISRETIEEVINSRIQPRIAGIRIAAVELKTTNSGRLVYVVEVPQSFDAPHQADDKRYYKRFNFQSIAMEDYEVRDVRNRARNPVVTAKFSRRSEPKQDNNGSVLVPLSLGLTNTGKVTAHNVYVEFEVPEQLYRDGIRSFHPSDTLELGEGENKQPYGRFTIHYRDVAGSVPLFPDTHADLFHPDSRHLSLRFEKGFFGPLGRPRNFLAEMFIYWRVFADASEPQVGQQPIRDLFNGWRLPSV